MCLSGIDKVASKEDGIIRVFTCVRGPSARSPGRRQPRLLPPQARVGRVLELQRRTSSIGSPTRFAGYALPATRPHLSLPKSHRTTLISDRCKTRGRKHSLNRALHGAPAIHDSNHETARSPGWIFRKSSGKLQSIHEIRSSCLTGGCSLLATTADATAMEETGADVRAPRAAAEGVGIMAT